MGEIYTHNGLLPLAAIMFHSQENAKLAFSDSVQKQMNHMTSKPADARGRRKLSTGPPTGSDAVSERHPSKSNAEHFQPDS